MSQPASQAIGFIGLGAMGGPMVRRLLGAGFAPVVYDANPAALTDIAAAGATAAASPKAVADTAEIVLVSLPTPDVVRTVALGTDGLVHGARIKVYADLSTTGARVAKEVATGFAPKGIQALDAPVSGGPMGATNGTLAIMVSGDAAAFSKAEPALRTIGSNTVYVGDQVGQGQMVKLINNMIAATNFAVTCEGLAMGMKAGLDADILLDLLNKSSGRSFATEMMAPAVLSRRFDFGFRLALMHKDVRLALEEAEALGTTNLTANAARQLWNYAMAHGMDGGDFTELAKVVEDFAGTEIIGKAAKRN
jgi:3-hydroxyisobutyrate dehydrogenase-like beta-hydroxyacid dehydrogenase